MLFFRKNAPKVRGLAKDYSEFCVLLLIDRSISSNSSNEKVDLVKIYKFQVF